MQDGGGLCQISGYSVGRDHEIPMLPLAPRIREG